MLGVVANKQTSDAKYIYIAKWYRADRTDCRLFRFGIVQDDNTQKVDFNKLSGLSGTMQIQTKSIIPFSPEDIVIFRGQKYTITLVDGNRKMSGEQAMARFNVNNGNVPIYLTLRKAG